MRRKDREITDPTQIEDILKKARVVHLGLSEGGQPYVVPLHYGYDLSGGKLTLYLHSAPEGRKLDLIRANPKVFVEIDTDELLVSGGDEPCRYGASYRSVMGEGKARLVEDPSEKLRGLKLLMQTQTGRDFPMTEEMTQGVSVICVEVRELTAKSRPRPEADHSAKMDAIKRFSGLDNQELFCIMTGDRGVIPQAYLHEIVREFHAKHGRDADLATMVKTILADHGGV